jgi:hypothetical protein
MQEEQVEKLEDMQQERTDTVQSMTMSCGNMLPLRVIQLHGRNLNPRMARPSSEIIIHDG